MANNERAVAVLMERDPVFKRFVGKTLGVTKPYEALFAPGGIAKMNPAPPDVSVPGAKPKNQKKGPVKPAGKLKPVQAVQPVKPIKPTGAPKTSRQPVAPSAVKAPKPGVSDPSKVVKSGGPPKTRVTPGRFRRTPLLAALGTGAVAAYGANKAKKYAGKKWRGYEVVDNLDKAESDFTIAKRDDEKQQVFGWASVISKDGQPVEDRQSDVIEADEMEKSAYQYVLQSRKGGHQHRRDGDEVYHVSDMIESMAFTPEKIEKMGLPPDTPVGWWVGFKVNDEDTWEKVKKGDVTAFSIHGRGKRVPIDD